MSTAHDFSGILVLLGVIITLGYAASCALFPYRTCRHCGGYGGFRSAILGAIRLCRACEGSGITLRAGRRLYNAAIRAYRRNHRANRRRRPHDDR